MSVTGAGVMGRWWCLLSQRGWNFGYGYGDCESKAQRDSLWGIPSHFIRWRPRIITNWDPIKASGMGRVQKRLNNVLRRKVSQTGTKWQMSIVKRGGG